MCGRLCCLCAPSSYCRRLKPAFKNTSLASSESAEFKPSPNVAPTQYVPVLHNNKQELLIRPMKWGIQGNISSGHVVHNLRLETLSTSRGFNSLVRHGQCCGIVCDGFYEWKSKSPYFFYGSTHEFDPTVITPKWQEEDWTERGPPAIILAGVYSSQTKNGAEIHTCAVITDNASTNTSQIHHRVPIILETESEVLDWLNTYSSTADDALRRLGAKKDAALAYYEVGSRMNSTKYQGRDCHFPKTCVPIDGAMSHWLNSGSHSLSQGQGASGLGCDIKPSKRKSDTSEGEPTRKKKTLITDWFKKPK